MTIFTVDVSSNQGALTVREIKAAGYAGFMARCSIGSRADSEYARFRAEARAAEFPFAPYHFLKSHEHTPLDVQAKALADSIGDKSLRYMLDVESDINSTPSWSDAVKFTVISQGLGCRIGSLYLPHWYWQRIGQPVIHTPLVASAYGENKAGPVNAIYPGDEFWPDAYGGTEPFLWQFGSRDRLIGAPHDNDAMDVDVNAYRGNVLPGSIFKHWVTPTVEEDEMKPFAVKDGSGNCWVIAADLSSRTQVTEDTLTALLGLGYQRNPMPGIDQTTLSRIPNVTGE
jgi:lysozyme